MSKIFDIESFKISPNIGFLLESPLKTLPKYFQPWNSLAEQLQELYKTKKVRDAVHELPLLDYKLLVGYRQFRLAHLQLSFITAGYVWQNGDAGVPKILPKSLAVPLYHISKFLGIQPILSHADLALANWSLIDKDGPFDFENLECIYHIPGGFSGEWFCIVPFMIEYSFARCLKNIVEIITLLDVVQQSKSADWLTAENEIATNLNDVHLSIGLMQKSLARMHDHLDAKTFFNEVRPFLAGWGGDSSPLPTGLVYEGAVESPVQMLGGSAAQSSSFQVLDALLGIQHKKNEFLQQMRDFMPPEHKRFITFLESKKFGLRQLIKTTNNQALQASYNACVTALVQLRSYHIQIVSKYVIAVSKSMNEGNYKSLDTKGTGGTSLIPFLKEIREDTEGMIAVVRQDKFSQISWLTKAGLVGLALSVLYGIGLIICKHT